MVKLFLMTSIVLVGFCFCCDLSDHPPLPLGGQWWYQKSFFCNSRGQKSKHKERADGSLMGSHVHQQNGLFHRSLPLSRPFLSNTHKLSIPSLTNTHIFACLHVYSRHKSVCGESGGCRRRNSGVQRGISKEPLIQMCYKAEVRWSLEAAGLWWWSILITSRWKLELQRFREINTICSAWLIYTERTTTSTVTTWHAVDLKSWNTGSSDGGLELRTQRWGVRKGYFPTYFHACLWIYRTRKRSSSRFWFKERNLYLCSLCVLCLLRQINKQLTAARSSIFRFKRMWYHNFNDWKNKAV